MKAIIFSRVSTMVQDLEQQEQALLQAAKADGFKDKDIIMISEHESAVKNDISERLGISKAKEAILSQDIKILYAFELSRIARRLDVFYEFRKFLIDHKVQLKILNPKVCLLNDAGEIDENFTLVFSIFASLAEQEARLMQARFKRGKQKLRDNHLWTGAGIPYGYTVNKNKEYIVKEDEAEVIRDIFKMYDTMTIVEIAKELVLSGRYEGSVNSVQVVVRNILNREYYSGKESNYNGYRTVNHTYKFPAIISVETFEAAKKKLKERKKYCKTKSKHTYLCRGIAVNINGEQLKPQISHNAYCILKANKYNWETLSFNIPFLDDIALHYAIENKKRKPGKDLMKYKIDLQDEIKVISKKVSVLDKKISEENEKIMKLEMRYASGKMSEETLDLLVGKIQETIKTYDDDRHCLEADREDLSRRLSNLSKSGKSPLLGRISDMTMEEKERLVKEELERIVIIKGKSWFNYTLGIQYFNGDYVMVDVNTRYKRVWDENGVEIEYKKTS